MDIWAIVLCFLKWKRILLVNTLHKDPTLKSMHVAHKHHIYHANSIKGFSNLQQTQIPVLHVLFDFPRCLFNSMVAPQYLGQHSLFTVINPS